MTIRGLMLGVLVLLLAPSASAQKIYKWTDEKGQWHFSNAPTPGVQVEEVRGLKTVPRPSAEAGPAVQQISNDTDSDPTATVARDQLPTRWLFVLSNKKIVDVFSSLEECEQFRNLLISHSETASKGIPKGDSIDYAKESRCMVSYALEPSTGDADVVIVSRRLIPDPVRVAHYELTGTVYNRGRATAKNVVVEYQILRVGGMKIGQGKLSIHPRDLPGGAVAEYRGKIVGIPSIDYRNIETEVSWTKERASAR